MFDPSGRYVFYATVDDVVAARHDLAARGRHATAPTTCRSSTSPTSGSGSASASPAAAGYLMIEAGSNITSETWLLDADDPTGEFRVVWPRKEGVEYDVEHVVARRPGPPADRAQRRRDQLRARERRGHPTRRVRDACCCRTTREVRLEGVDAFRDFVAARVPPRGPDPGRDREGAAGRHPGGCHARRHPARAAVRRGALLGRRRRQPRLDAADAAPRLHELRHPVDRLRRTSSRPASGSCASGSPCSATTTPTRYEQRREWAIADDGTRIPISLVYRHDLVDARASPRRPLLYGYGSYEHAIDPAFGIPRLSLLDRGMVFAVAHVRGGGEMGRLWYEHGKKLAQAEHLHRLRRGARHLIDEDCHRARPARRPGRQRRRPADGRRREPGARGSSRGSSPRCRSSTRSRRSSTRRCR